MFFGKNQEKNSNASKEFKNLFEITKTFQLGM